MNGPAHSSTDPWFRRAGFDVQEFSANSVRTFAVVEGKRDQFPVIFLHGTPGGAFIWEYVIAALGRKRLAIAPDFPGWGRSVSSHEELPSPSPEWSLKWLNGFAAAQGVDRFDLVAHGTGCWLALEMLATDAARVRRLSLVSLPLTGTTDQVSILGMIGGKRSHWTPSRLENWMNSRARLKPETVERHQGDFAIREESPPRLLPERGYVNRFERYWEALRAYHGAMQLIWGGEDDLNDTENSQRLMATLDRPDVHHIEGAGHYPMLDQPQHVTPLLREFLED